MNLFFLFWSKIQYPYVWNRSWEIPCISITNLALSLHLLFQRTNYKYNTCVLGLVRILTRAEFSWHDPTDYYNAYRKHKHHFHYETQFDATLKTWLQISFEKFYTFLLFYSLELPLVYKISKFQIQTGVD